MCLEKLTAVVVLQFFPASKALFRRDCPNKLTPYPLSKKSLFQKLATRVRNFSFPGRSLTRLFPGRNTNPFRLKTFFQTRKLTFSRLGNVCFSAGNKHFYHFFNFPRRPPPTSQARGFETTFSTRKLTC